jgi:hypothetical protein
VPRSSSVKNFPFAMPRKPRMVEPTEPRDDARGMCRASDTLAHRLEPSGVLGREKVQFEWSGWLPVVLARLEKRQKDYIEPSFWWLVHYRVGWDVVAWKNPTSFSKGKPRCV